MLEVHLLFFFFFVAMERKRELSEKYTRAAMMASTKHAFWRNWHR